MDVAEGWKTVLRVVETYRGSATGAGSALGITIVDSELANRPSYQGQLVKILDGDAAGQIRPISTHVTNTLTVPSAFTDSSGSVVQITIGTHFTIISFGGGGGGGAAVVAPSIGLWMFGICDPGMGASTTALTLTNLAGFPDDLFNGEFWIQIIHNANSVGNAPEGEYRRVTDYAGTGAFTCDAFTVNVEANDLVCLFHESLLSTEILARGTLDTSSATVPADSSRSEGDDYFKGALLMTTEGAVRFQPRRIVVYTGAGGIFGLDANNPFTGAPGTVDYIIIGGQTEFVPGVDGTNNRTPADVIGGKADTALQAVAANASQMRYLKGLITALGDPTAHTLATITAKWGDIARSLDLILGARWDGAGDLGTDIAAIIGDLATLLTRLSAVRAGYLDELDFDLQGTLDAIVAYLDTEIDAILALVDSAESAGPFSYLDAGGEQDVVEDTAVTRRRIWLEFSNRNMAQTGTFRIYRKVDGANYDLYAEQPVTVGAGDERAFDAEFTTNQAWKLTYEEDVDEGAAKAIPFNVITQVIE